MAKQTDPVCNMQIEEQDAAGQTEYEETTYYFVRPRANNNLMRIRRGLRTNRKIKNKGR